MVRYIQVKERKKEKSPFLNETGIIQEKFSLFPKQVEYNIILESCQSADQIPKNRNKDCTLTTEEMGIIECSKMYLILVYYMYQR